MAIAVAQVPTPRADRYLAQLCDHLGAMKRGLLGRLHRRPDHGSGHRYTPAVRAIDRAGDQARIEFDWGTCTLTASPDRLTVRVHADEPEALVRGQGLIARRIEAIGRREHLVVVWEPSAAG